MPLFPTKRMMAPELSRQPHRITATVRKMATGATASTQGSKPSVFALTLDAELMIIAMVPGPAVLGMANGTKAMLADVLWRSSCDLLSTSGASSGLCWGTTCENR